MSEKFINAEVQGLDQLRAALMEKAPKEARSIVRKAIRAGAAIFKESVVAEAPKRSGFLSQHFRIRTRARGDNAAAYVVPDSKALYPNEAKTFGRKGRNRNVGQVARYAEFGTATEPANPFITRGFEISKGRVLSKVIEILRSLLSKPA